MSRKKRARNSTSHYRCKIVAADGSGTTRVGKHACAPAQVLQVCAAETPGLDRSRPD